MGQCEERDRNYEGRDLEEACDDSINGALILSTILLILGLWNPIPNLFKSKSPPNHRTPASRLELGLNPGNNPFVLPNILSESPHSQYLTKYTLGLDPSYQWQVTN